MKLNLNRIGSVEVSESFKLYAETGCILFTADGNHGVIEHDPVKNEIEEMFSTLGTIPDYAHHKKSSFQRTQFEYHGSYGH